MARSPKCLVCPILASVGALIAIGPFACLPICLLAQNTLANSHCLIRPYIVLSHSILCFTEQCNRHVTAKNCKHIKNQSHMHAVRINYIAHTYMAYYIMNTQGPPL